MTYVRGVAIIALCCIPFLGACGGGDADESTGGTERSPTLAEVVDRHADELVAMDGVSAVGAAMLPGRRPCVRVFVVELTEELRELLPEHLEGYPVDIEVSGDFVPVEAQVEEGES
ncbi:MAG: hypothetical protein GY838_16090 [bacterium]|nr:hypothetical protein [bacterium]